MKWNKYNTDNGYYTESVISEVQPKNSTEIEISVPIEFAKFDGTQWIDGRTKEELLKEKENQLLQLNQMQFEELSKTDWAYIRERELNIDVPIEIVEERKAIREKFNKLKQLIITIDLNNEQRTI
jgi:hypothetical protein